MNMTLNTTKTKTWRWIGISWDVEGRKAWTVQTSHQLKNVIVGADEVRLSLFRDDYCPDWDTAANDEILGFDFIQSWKKGEEIALSRPAQKRVAKEVNPTIKTYRKNFLDVHPRAWSATNEVGDPRLPGDDAKLVIVKTVKHRTIKGEDVAECVFQMAGTMEARQAVAMLDPSNSMTSEWGGHDNKTQSFSWTDSDEYADTLVTVSITW